MASNSLSNFNPSYGGYIPMHRAPLLVVGTPRDVKYWCRYNKIKVDWIRIIQKLDQMRGYSPRTAIHFVGDWVRLPQAADMVKFAQYMDFEINGEKLEHAPTQVSGYRQLGTTQVWSGANTVTTYDTVNGTYETKQF